MRVQPKVRRRRVALGTAIAALALAPAAVHGNVDVIVTGANPVIAAVPKATTTIPVVMAASRDRVGSGFIASLARPGANVTGLTSDPSPEFHGKRLELLKVAIPGATRIALLWNPLPSSAGTYRKVVEDAAAGMGMNVQVVPQHRLPAAYQAREFVDIGGLMSYGDNVAHRFRRAAAYVDKILRGAKPGELPVEQSTKFELVLNLKTAQQLGLTLPPALLLRAGETLQ